MLFYIGNKIEYIIFRDRISDVYFKKNIVYVNKKLKKKITLPSH